MRGSVVRVTKVLAVYVVVAGLLWGALPGIRRVFLLPALFGTMAEGALVVGGFFAALVAWRYPHMGVGGKGDGEERRE